MPFPARSHGSRTRWRRLAARALDLSRAPAGEPSVRILTYHRVNDGHPGDRLTVSTREFAAQMAHLAATRRTVSLAQAVAGLRSGTGLEPGTVVLTFDDGYRDNFELALPILERHGLAATFFVVSGRVGTDETIERYARCCGEDRMMDWSQVRALLDRGHEVGGHGRRHRELVALTAAELLEEVEGCRRDLERETGRPAAFFCYPRGSESPAARRVVAETGFEAACTVYPGANRPGADLFALRRTEISGDDRLEDFRRKLDGGYDRLHRAVQALQRWRRR